MRRIHKVGLPLVAVLSLAGCSQAAQLTQVAGAGVTAVRNATNDVLVEQRIPVGVAPVCTYEGTNYTCKGTAQNGEEIVAEAKQVAPYGATKNEYGIANSAKIELVIRVGNRQIFTGDVHEVLSKNGQVSS